MSVAIATKPRVRVPAGRQVLPALPAARPAPQSAFMRGEHSPTFRGWHPSLRSASDDVRQAWRLASARAVDMIQNSGWLAGGAEQSRAAVVGDGLTLNAKPDAVALGMTEDEASVWARRVERRFESWANSPWACDAGARFTLGQMGAQIYDHWQATGEGLATFPYFMRPGSEFSTKIMVLPAWQLSDRSELPNLIQGVRIDATGAPISYRMRTNSPFGNGLLTSGTVDIEVLGRDAMGRPLVAHIFDGVPGQVRGITPFAPILKVTRQFDQLADATLTTAIQQAIFAATLKSERLPEEVLEGLQTETEQQGKAMHNLRSGWYENVDIDLGVHGKIANLYPGDELNFLRSEHPNATYEPFAKFLLRECSRALALTYEEYSGDYAGATYSSIKMGTAVIWPRVKYRRRNVPARFHQTAYEAWLEEDIEAGRTPFPGGVAAFLARKDAASRAEWRGPPKPQADDLKTAKAFETLDVMGVISHEQICADLGTDVDDVYEQRKREMTRRAALGLPEPARVSDAVGNALASETEPKPGVGNG